MYFSRLRVDGVVRESENIYSSRIWIILKTLALAMTIFIVFLKISTVSNFNKIQLCGFEKYHLSFYAGSGTGNIRPAGQTRPATGF